MNDFRLIGRLAAPFSFLFELSVLSCFEYDFLLYNALKLVLNKYLS